MCKGLCRWGQPVWQRAQGHDSLECMASGWQDVQTQREQPNVPQRVGSSENLQFELAKEKLWEGGEGDEGGNLLIMSLLRKLNVKSLER